WLIFEPSARSPDPVRYQIVPETEPSDIRARKSVEPLWAIPICFQYEHDDQTDADDHVAEDRAAADHLAARGRNAAGVSLARRRLQGRVLPRRADDRHLLPADVPRPQAAAEKCGVFRYAAGGAHRRLPAVQALPTAGAG